MTDQFNNQFNNKNLQRKKNGKYQCKTQCNLVHNCPCNYRNRNRYSLRNRLCNCLHIQKYNHKGSQVLLGFHVMRH